MYWGVQGCEEGIEVADVCDVVERDAREVKIARMAGRLGRTDPEMESFVRVLAWRGREEMQEGWRERSAWSKLREVRVEEDEAKRGWIRAGVLVEGPMVRVWRRKVGFNLGTEMSPGKVMSSRSLLTSANRANCQTPAGASERKGSAPTRDRRFIQSVFF